jgi:hypothetical protein
MSAILLLIVIERRKPVMPREVAGRVPVLQRETKRVDVVELPMRRYKRTPIWRRLVALTGLGISSLVLGAIAAITVTAAIVGLMLALSGLAK